MIIDYSYRIINLTRMFAFGKCLLRLKLYLLLVFRFRLFSFPDTQSGVLRIWSVSRDAPILNLKIKETGFHSICVIPNNLITYNMKPKCTLSAASSTSLSSGKSSSSGSHTYEIPPARVVCTFLDGGIGLYDIHKRHWDFVRDYVSCPSVQF